MQGGNVVFHTSILNVPATITPLKFQEWLRLEAAQIQKMCTDSSFTIIKLFLPFRIRLAYTHAQLDSLLQDIPNQHPNIHWIDVVLVENSPSNDEITAIAENEQKCIDALNKSVEEFLRTKKQD